MGRKHRRFSATRTVVRADELHASDEPQAQPGMFGIFDHLRARYVAWHIAHVDAVRDARTRNEEVE